MSSRTRTMMTSKIHRATVTQADLDYVGSITVDADLLDAADLLPGERVDVCDCENGNRLSTYVIPGERGAGEICINGAAARLVNPGDVVILIAYSQLPDDEARTYLPRVVFVDEHNHVVDRSAEPGGVPTEGVGADVARLQGLRPSGIPLAEARA
ncbi:aspartate 1-decarboxylase [Actinomyces haliotis]|uniref:aspartate 1-decarboxylase n=1 Tax=Actinomyces haliotis TaxID=1280843 RepID=UPI00188EB3CF|nr:aspartate 1-decarboxylase [Actinomyces haliotis]